MLCYVMLCYAMYVCMCVCMYLSIYLLIHMYVSLYICIYVFMHLCMYVCMYLCIHVVYIRMCIRVYTTIHMHVYLTGFAPYHQPSAAGATCCRAGRRRVLCLSLLCALTPLSKLGYPLRAAASALSCRIPELIRRIKLDFCVSCCW